MTILGARVALVLLAQAAYPGPANTHSPPTRYPDHIPRIIEAMKARAAAH